MNKKGFTLIEMLAVIVLLGILSTFTAVSITKTYKKQKNENYRNEISQILSGARNYFSDNLGETKVKVKELIPKYADVSAATKDRVGLETEVSLVNCGNSIKNKIRIYAPSSLEGAGRKTNYNDCGCDSQPDKAEESDKICEDK